MPDPTPPPAVDIDPADTAPPADIPTTVDTGLGQAVARFQALSDTAGNPGAPAPGPGVADVAAVANAAHAGEPLTHSLNSIGERIDHVASGIANLSIRLRDEHEQVMLLLGRVEGKLDLLAEIRALLAGRTVVHAAPTQAQAQAQARYDRTLTTMDRVTQYDAQGLIHEHLMAAVRDGQVCDGPTAGRLAHEIAEALYGPATETAPLDLRGHACTRPVGPPGPPYGEPPACGQPATEVDSIGRPRCPEHLTQAQNATSVDTEAAPTEAPTCGATLDQGCNTTGNIHRCTTVLGIVHHVDNEHRCDCSTRWPTTPGTDS